MTRNDTAALLPFKQRLGALIEACYRRDILKIGRGEYCKKILAVNEAKDLAVIKSGILKYETLINEADTAQNQNRKTVKHTL